LIKEAEELGKEIGITKACQALVVPRSRLYRARKEQSETEKSAIRSKSHPRSLSQEEKIKVRQLLNSDRFQDQAPREVYATLLDEGVYHCSWRTMYRILDEYKEVRERRNQLTHPNYLKPELLATGPNQVWSWDITKLLGPEKWTYYYLYVILDIYSRYVVGWMIAPKETAALARELIKKTCKKQNIQNNQLTIHADRGSPMIAKSTTMLMADLGVTKTHSRPHVSDDNPFSEAQFRTMKYRPDYPKRFGSQQDARLWARQFFDWYNTEHHHSGIGLMAPADVHHGHAEQIIQRRQKVLQNAYMKNPERFVKGMPAPPQLPEAVWINPPKRPPTEKHGDPVKIPMLKHFDLREHLPEAGALSRVVQVSDKDVLHPPLTGWPEEYNCPQEVFQLDT
jgi:putative transposase